jgi:hypothetical protein
MPLSLHRRRNTREQSLSFVDIKGFKSLNAVMSSLAALKADAVSTSETLASFYGLHSAIYQTTLLFMLETLTV